MQETNDSSINNPESERKPDEKRVSRKWLKISFLFLVLIGGGILTFFISTPFKESSERGRVLEFQKEGFIFKSWEGSIVRISDPLNESSELKKFSFSVANDDTSNQKIIENAKLYNKPVRIDYKEKYFRFFWEGKSTFMVTNASIDSLNN